MLIFLLATIGGFVVLMIMLLLGGDHEIQLEHDVSIGEGDLGHPNVLSIRVIAAAITGWGVVGYLARYFGGTMFASSVIGLGGAFFFGAIAYGFALLFYTSQASTTIMEKDMVGVSGRVSVKIPAAGTGQVFCTVKGKSISTLAIAESREAIEEGQIVTITGMRGDVAVVKKPTV
jgi:hypothetical protein